MNFSTLSLIVLAGTAPSALATPFASVSTERNVTVDASVFDRDDGDQDLVTVVSTASGLFAEQEGTSVVSTNFRTSGSGVASQQSVVDTTRIALSSRVEADAFGADPEGGADIVSTSGLVATIAVTETTRIAMNAFVLSDTDRSVATVASGVVSLTDDAGNAVFSLVVVGDENEAEFEGWIQPGVYTFTADASVGIQFSGAINDEQDRFGEFGETEIESTLTPFNAADYNLSGDVTQADKDAFLAAWRADNLIADFNGDGTIDRDDRRGYNRAFRRATR